MINKALGELIPVGGGDNIPLLKTTLIIGRRPSCDISLPYPNVSSHHCKLNLQNGYWFFEDLNSSNGIKVNGERCESRFLLPNDEITIAKHHFTINYEPVGELPELTLENPFSKSLMEKAGLEKKPKIREYADEDSAAVMKSVERQNSTPGADGGKKQVDDQIQDWLQ